MTNAYFFDSSAVVKKYVSEIGTNFILSITDAAIVDSLAISQITWVEVLSAFSRRQREGSLSVDEVDERVERFRDDFKNLYQVVRIDNNLIERAGQLVLQYPLRAYDAVQLASALQVRSLLASFPDIQLIFVSADDRLLNIAKKEALPTENPNNYP